MRSMYLEERRALVERASKYYLNDFDAGMTAVENLDKAINGGNQAVIAEGIFHTLRVTHRFLQNEIILALVRVLIGLASEPTDARNEYGIGLCKRIKVALGKDVGWLDLPERKEAE